LKSDSSADSPKPGVAGKQSDNTAAAAIVAAAKPLRTSIAILDASHQHETATRLSSGGAAGSDRRPGQQFSVKAAIAVFCNGNQTLALTTHSRLVMGIYEFASGRFVQGALRSNAESNLGAADL
jgi:hypothetical protein